MQKRRYVDSVRGWAILGVIFIHTAIAADWELLPFDAIIDSGQYGVQLFFVASAFTLFLSLNTRSQHQPVNSFHFYLRRLFRIAPLYYVGILYYCFDRYIGFHFFINGTVRQFPPLDALISNLFFVHSFNPDWNNSIVPGGWSIACEMMFYLFVPFLFSSIKNFNHALLFLFTALIISLSWNLLLQNNPNWNREYFIYCSLLNQLPVFALGILVFFLVEGGNIKVNKVAATAVLLALFANALATTVTYLIFAAFGALLLVILSKKEYTVLVNAVTVGLGKVSYSMYVTHFAVMFWLDKLNLLTLFAGSTPWIIVLNFAARYFVVVIVSALASSVTYKLIEIPFQRLGSSLIQKTKVDTRYI